MKFHIKILILTLVLLVGGLLSYSLIKNGYFPVARVNNSFISYRAVKENAEVSRRLYSQGYAGSSEVMDQFFRRANGSDLIKASLESLIAQQVIKSAASPDVLDQVQTEITKNFSDANTQALSNSINAIYGWDFSKFKERILEPSALTQVLSQAKGAEFDNWLAGVKSTAQVRIWFLPFEWKGGKLENRN